MIRKKGVTNIVIAVVIHEILVAHAHRDPSQHLVFPEIHQLLLHGCKHVSEVIDVHLFTSVKHLHPPPAVCPPHSRQAHCAICDGRCSMLKGPYSTEWRAGLLGEPRLEGIASRFIIAII